MGLSPYDKKRYKESKLRRRQALYQSETGYIVPYRRSKKPIIIAACAAALLLIAAAVVLVVASLDNRDAGSSSRQTDLNSEERLRVVNRANTVDKDFKPALKSFGGVKVHKDIVNSLEKLTEAAKIHEEMLSLNKKHEEMMAVAKKERDAILAEARKVSDELYEKAKLKAAAESQAMIEDAKKAIYYEKMKAITDAKNAIANFSIDIAQKVITEELKDRDKQEALVEKWLEDCHFN